MLKNYTPRKHKTAIKYELCFDDGHNNGFGFPCDAQGNVPDDLNQNAKDNLAFCLAHPENFKRFNKVVKYEWKYCEPARGTCTCGREVELWDEYYGACSCDCGKWYNLFGQELLPPDQWENDPAEEEYW